MSVLLTRYLMYFNCVTTPMERRKMIHSDYHLYLSLKICVIYINSHCTHAKGFMNYESSIELFYESEETGKRNAEYAKRREFRYFMESLSRETGIPFLARWVSSVSSSPWSRSHFLWI